MTLRCCEAVRRQQVERGRVRPGGDGSNNPQT